ncbi:hypothetical protein E4198_18035 [Streptomyces sp. RKND-216]|uniref:beta-N-acetylhexosaminidase n=1 Tax=Streptomyces sp. RKND-216 TaxID=2562581 RepID=UPI00109DEE55|nr:beta-N-acetylhexosaminidase [Streptomyces sp. RKND-216]THA26335.1 hypothetical protein E4198_18035 [Streptomyces sp. RKND-216]
MSVTTQGAGGPSDGGAASRIAVVPQPVSVQPDAGAAYELTAGDAVHASAGSRAAQDAAGFLAELLRTPTGFPLPVREVPAGEESPGGVALLLDEADTATDPGSYTVDVTPRGVTIRAGEREGLFNGVATLRQLLPVRIDSPERVEGCPWRIPGGRVIDRPRYVYRGAMLDVARNFMPPVDVKRYIDSLARYKINHLHLHLTDDQGWRIEITSRPELTATGGGSGAGGISKGHYTQDEYRDLVAHAWSRGITVVPEIEGPNHAHAALASYGELSEDGTAPPLHVGYGPSQQGLAIQGEETYALLDDVIREVAAMTPGPYLHVGGDETDNRTPEDLAHYFGRIAQLVRKYGKQLIGWQESAAHLEPADTVTEFWVQGRNDEQVIAAAEGGAKVIVAPCEHAYLDMRYAPGKPEYPVGTDWAGTVDLRKSYAWQPEDLLDGLPAKAVMGVEAALWTEVVFGINQAELLAFPRLLAVAETGWSPAAAKDWDGFAERVAAQGPRLRQAGVNYYRTPEVRWPFGS